MVVFVVGGVGKEEPIESLVFVKVVGRRFRDEWWHFSFNAMIEDYWRIFELFRLNLLL